MTTIEVSKKRKCHLEEKGECEEKRKCHLEKKRKCDEKRKCHLQRRGSVKRSVVEGRGSDTWKRRGNVAEGGRGRG